MNTSNLKIAYFGGEPLGVPILTELEKAGIVPSVVVCNPDRPVGRKQVLTAPPVKQWALERNIKVIQPTHIPKTPPKGIVSLSLEKTKEIRKTDNIMDIGIVSLIDIPWDLFIVVAYNHILPKWIIDIPKYGTVNVHPSLLPLLRGASPIRTSILQDMREQCGVTIMQMDEKMDHGPILAQRTLEIPETNWPVYGNELDMTLAQLGGTLLANTIPKYVNEEITPQEQDHTQATYCGRLDRSMGELTLDPHNLPTGDDAYQTLLKIRAFDGFPGTFFMYEGKRVKVLDAQIAFGNLCITRVLPEGKKEMDFDTYLQSIS